MHHSVPYTLRQKGVEECKDRELKGMETCMIEAYDLNSNTWTEAITCDAYVQNRAPPKSLDGKTPYEAWFHHKPNVSHFRVFGSKAWANFPP